MCHEGALNHDICFVCVLCGQVLSRFTGATGVFIAAPGHPGVVTYFVSLLMLTYPCVFLYPDKLKDKDLDMIG